MTSSPAPQTSPRRAVVVVASNRASAGVYPDRTGPTIVEWLRQRGYQTPDPVVVPDGSPVRHAMARAIADAVDVVLTTGGTGISPTDRTPEATSPLLDRLLPGLADAIRSAGLPQVPTAVLSRGLAGVAGRTLIVNLPGSTGGVRDGLGVLADVLDHAVEQLHGADHTGSGTGVPTGPAPHPGSDPGSADSPSHGHQHGPGPGAGGHGHGHGHGAGHLSGGAGHLPGHTNGSPSAVVTPTGTGTGEVLRAVVTEEPLDVEEHARLVSRSTTGAVVTFSGLVRDHDGGRGVRALEYSGHPTAGEVIARVAAQIAAAYPAVQALAVSHRIGALRIGDSALACAVSAAHRQDAFTACAALVDEVKLQLPIWKRQEFADGSHEWVNCP
jgi:molybdenum cofactor synthesis domain-containing protein